MQQRNAETERRRRAKGYEQLRRRVKWRLTYRCVKQRALDKPQIIPPFLRRAECMRAGYKDSVAELPSSSFTSLASLLSTLDSQTHGFFRCYRPNQPRRSFSCAYGGASVARASVQRPKPQGEPSASRTSDTLAHTSSTGIRGHDQQCGSPQGD